MSQSAQQAEAANAPIKTTWRDREWTAPAPNDWPWDVFEAIDDGKFTHALRGLLSAEDYAAFKALDHSKHRPGAKRPTGTDGGELLEALVKAGGFEDSGE